MQLNLIDIKWAAFALRGYIQQMVNDGNEQSMVEPYIVAYFNLSAFAEDRTPITLAEAAAVPEKERQAAFAEGIARSDWEVGHEVLRWRAIDAKRNARADELRKYRATAARPTCAP